jgi:hypothetical protein
MKNSFILAKIATLFPEIRCNRERSNRFLFSCFLTLASRLRNKPDLFRLIPKQTEAIFSQSKFNFHLSETPQ